MKYSTQPVRGSMQKLCSRKKISDLFGLHRPCFFSGKVSQVPPG